MRITSITVPLIENHIADHFFKIEEEIVPPVQWTEVRRHCRMIMNKYKTISNLLKRRGLFSEEYGKNLCQICIILHRMERVAIDRDTQSLLLLRAMHQEVTDLAAELSCRLHALIDIPALSSETAY
jgi:hypothetical protein